VIVKVKRPVTTSTSAAVATRVPATYTITASGLLSPRTVSAPAGYNVQLTFVNRDAAAASVIVHTKPLLELAVPSHRTLSAAERHLPKGTYRISINGHDGAGTLVIGSAPGP
jgi:hypothetical protein